MIHNEKIVLRKLTDGDKLSLAQLANNKKIWNNMRDVLPHPYTIDDAIFFINLTRMRIRK